MNTIHGFELIRDEQVPDLNTRARLYRHVQTGAELLSLENTDENKVFGITFRTPPQDSTGIAHIMEHSVLCGSRKYPVKEPFVELMKGSLNTFLNAMTFPDKTCYPVASQNLQDFYNLVDVYLDAVLYPILSPYTLKQEGWHFELDGLDDPLSYQGVVFNEMKGVYSSPDDVLDEYSQRAVYPDTEYSYDSGGDPRDIPQLTYAQFKHFHDTYYHPSNARIFFWGDDAPEERLRLIDEYLKDFQRITVDSRIRIQPRWNAPQAVEKFYDASVEEENPGALLTVNWLLPEVGDAEKTLALEILQHILIGTPASPLRKALIESGLGEDLTGRGLETSLQQMFFSAGLKGVALEDIGAVEQLILNTLEQLVRDGIDPLDVAAAVNTIEFLLRENNTGSYPRGLVVMLRALDFWLYDHDPLAGLRFEAPLQAVKDRLASDAGYLEALIRTHLLENTHRVTVVLKPQVGLGQKMAAEEQMRLDTARAAMGSADLQAVLTDAQELRRRQSAADSPEALATIPMLKLSDLDRKVRSIPSEQTELAGSTVLYHDLPTNGILYFDLGFDLHTLPQSWLPYVPLFGRALLETGTAQEDFVQLLQRIGRNTGGIHPSMMVSARHQSPESVAWLFLRSKAMLSQSGELFAILRDVLTGARLDQRERFRQMALEEKASMTASLTNMGHRYVNLRLRSNFNEAGWVNEQMSGISYLFFLRRLIDQIDQNWEQVHERLEAIRQTLLNRSSMLCNVTTDAAGWGSAQPELGSFLAGLPDAAVAREPWVQSTVPVSEGLTLPSQVNFVGKAANLYQNGYRMHGSEMVITSHLGGTWLWDRVRVQGGAYGSFCQFDQNTGVVSFLSYRDPNVERTLDTYDQAGSFLREMELDDAELSKAIIGTIGDLDAYQLPDAKGYTALVRHLIGYTDEQRQQWRDEVLATRREDFVAFGEQLEYLREQGVVVVLGAPESVQAASESKPGWLEITRIV